jgi:hypothetical protein
MNFLQRQADPHRHRRIAPRLPVGQAVRFITHIGRLESGLAVALTHSYCRSEPHDFVAEMRRDA